MERLVESRSSHRNSRAFGSSNGEGSGFEIMTESKVAGSLEGS